MNHGSQRRFKHFLPKTPIVVLNQVLAKNAKGKTSLNSTTDHRRLATNHLRLTT